VAVGGRQYGTDRYRATRPDGRQLGIKIRRGGDRAADSAVQTWRTLRLRQPAGEHPLWPPERRVEHEALAAMVAHRAGVPAPEVLAVSRLGVDDDSAMIAVEAI